jgi:hypothetical protein
MLWGLLLGNLVDLDHIYYRLIGKVGWFESACSHFGVPCSYNFYPLHNMTFIVIFLRLSLLTVKKNKTIKFIGWLSMGAALNIILDLIASVTGFAI